ncbi:hypothetical protein MY11210_008743 [Beauveria gryllotalpidicola]
MPISEGTSAELATIIAQINVVVDELAEKERQLEAIKNLDPQVVRMLSSQANSSRKIRNATVQPAVPGQDPMDMEEIRLRSQIEALLVKQMELGARQRELEIKQ